MTFGTFYIISTIAAIIVAILLIVLKVNEFETFTIGTYIVMTFVLSVPLVGFTFALIGLSLIIYTIGEKIYEKWYDFLSKRPFK